MKTIKKNTIWLCLLMSGYFMLSCNASMESDAKENLNLPRTDSSCIKVGSIITDSITSLINQNNLQDALELAIVYTNQCPENSNAYNQLSIVRLRLGQDSLAQISIDKALELNPKSFTALTGKGILLAKKGDNRSSIKCYLLALKENPDYAPAYSNLMGSYVNLGEYDSAKVYCEKSVMLGNNLGDKGMLCGIYHMLGEYDKRDSLFKVLQKANYANIDKLRELIGTKK